MRSTRMAVRGWGSYLPGSHLSLQGVDPGPFRVYTVDDKLAETDLSSCIIPITLPSRLQPNGTYRSQEGEGFIPRNKEIPFHISGSVRYKSTFTLFGPI